MPATISCAANSVTAGGAAFAGMSQEEKLSAIIYLLALIAGTSLNANTLMAGGSAYAGMSEEEKLSVIVYLLCQLSNDETP